METILLYKGPKTPKKTFETIMMMISRTFSRIKNIYFKSIRASTLNRLKTFYGKIASFTTNWIEAGNNITPNQELDAFLKAIRELFGIIYI